MHTTRQPSERSLSQRWLPMKLAPPVTNARGFLVADLAPVIATSESPVQQSCFPRGDGIEGVTAVHDELWVPHQRGNLLGIKASHLLPLGHYHRRVGPPQRLVGVEDGLNVGREPGCGLACHGVIAYDPGPESGQGAGDGQARSPSQVVRIRLEREPEQGHTSALEGVEIPLELVDHPSALPLVHGGGRVQERGLVLVLAGCGPQGGHVFGEARPAPTEPRGEEAGPYAVVEADAVGNLGDLGTDQLAEVGDLVYEADLGRKEGVGCVLDHLGTCDVRRHERNCDLGAGIPFRGEALLHYRGVEGPEDVESLPGVRTHHHTVGEEGVVDGAAFPQELRVGGDPELCALASRLVYALADQRGDVVGATHRHRALVCYDERKLARCRLAERPPYRAGHIGHVREVGRSVTALRRTDGYDEDVRPSYDLGQSLGAGKSEPSCALGY